MPCERAIMSWSMSVWPRPRMAGQDKEVILAVHPDRPRVKRNLVKFREGLAERIGKEAADEYIRRRYRQLWIK